MRSVALLALTVPILLSMAPGTTQTASACGGMTQIDPPSLELAAPYDDRTLPPHDCVIVARSFRTVASPPGEDCGCGLRVPLGSIDGLAGILVVGHADGTVVDAFGLFTPSPATTSQLNAPGSNPPVSIPQEPGQVWTGAHVQLSDSVPGDLEVDLVFLLQAADGCDQVFDGVSTGNALALGALDADLTFQDPTHYTSGEDFDVIGPDAVPVSFYGHEVTPLGRAQLTWFPGTDGAEFLTVSNLGSSGLDGISIQMSGSPGVNLGYDPVDLGSTAGASMEFEVRYQASIPAKAMPFSPMLIAHRLQSQDGGTRIDARVESEFEVDLNTVRVYQGPEVVEEADVPMGTQAFTTGNTVAFRSEPDLHTAAHEAAHVLQQGSGVSVGGGSPKASVIGDRIGITPVSPLTQESIEMLRVRFSGTGDVTFHTLGAQPTAAPDPVVSVLQLRPGVPNPSSASSTLRFRTPAPGRVQLAIYDLAGRKVRTLVQEDLDAGEHTAIWSGVDGTGRGVAAGVYVSRLTFGLEVRTAKLVLR